MFLVYFEQLIRLVHSEDFTELQLNRLNSINQKFLNHISTCNELYISNNHKMDLNFQLNVSHEISDLINLYNTNRSILDNFLSLAMGNHVIANQNRLDWEIQ